MEKNKIMSTTVDSQAGYMLLQFNGDPVHDAIDQFKKDIDHSSKMIEEESKKSGQKIRILLDMTNFSGNYALDALSALVSFAKHNEPFVERTASFGGSDKVTMAGEVAIALSGRKNIKLFDTRHDAVAWLMDNMGRI